MHLLKRLPHEWLRLPVHYGAPSKTKAVTSNCQSMLEPGKEGFDSILKTSNQILAHSGSTRLKKEKEEEEEERRKKKKERKKERKEKKEQKGFKLPILNFGVKFNFNPGDDRGKEHATWPYYIH